MKTLSLILRAPLHLVPVGVMLLAASLAGKPSDFTCSMTVGGTIAIRGYTGAEGARFQAKSMGCPSLKSMGRSESAPVLRVLSSLIASRALDTARFRSACLRPPTRLLLWKCALISPVPFGFPSPRMHSKKVGPTSMTPLGPATRPGFIECFHREWPRGIVGCALTMWSAQSFVVGRGAETRIIPAVYGNCFGKKENGAYSNNAGLRTNRPRPRLSKQKRVWSSPRFTGTGSTRRG